MPFATQRKSMISKSRKQLTTLPQMPVPVHFLVLDRVYKSKSSHKCKVYFSILYHAHHMLRDLIVFRGLVESLYIVCILEWNIWTSPGFQNEWPSIMQLVRSPLLPS